MSLRFRLNLLITLMFVVILIAGALLVVHNARRSVAEETDATSSLTVQLLEVAFANIGPDHNPMDVVLGHLGRYGRTRHLSIDLIDEGGRRQRIAPEQGSLSDTIPPDWFVGLVRPAPQTIVREIAVPGSSRFRIVVQADPGDEIREAWKEARATLGLLVTFCLLANGLVFFTLGHWLRPIDQILRALDRIGQGDYHSRLPAIGLPELDSIAGNFNHMAEALETSREQNRQLAQKSLAIREQERRFLAHELHDELGQSVSAIKALAVSIGQRAPEQPEIAASAGTIAQTAHRIYEAVRGMMRQLRPVILDELGLVPALQNLTDEWNEHHEDSFCHFAADGDFADLGDDMRINLYRIVQEALTNAARHARASEVTVDLQRRPGRIELRIADNGVGMTPAVIKPGLGLPGMRERAESMGGRLTLTSKPGYGMVIEVSVPPAVKTDG